MKTGDSSKEKITSSKLVGFPPTLIGRLKRVAAMRNETENEIIRRGLVAELDRIESEASVETLRMSKLNALARARGVGIDNVLDELLRQHTDPELGLPTEVVAGT